MKKISLTFLLTGFALLSCSSQKSSSSYSHSEEGQHSVVIKDDGLSFELKYQGEISFTEDENAFQSISAGGYLKYKRNGKKLTVVQDEGAQIQYEIDGSKRKTTLDAAEKEFVAAAIKNMISYGVGANDRVKRIYQREGIAAVLKEIASLKTDYVKAIYLDYLLGTGKLSASELTELAGKIGTLLHSDFEKAGLLKKFPSQYFADAATTQAYLDAVGSIDSDFEKAGTLSSILNGPLSADNFTKAIQLSGTINSDFEKAGVLKNVLDNTSLSSAQFSEVLKATGSIDSDFEKAGVLKEVLSNNNLPEERFGETLSVISSVSSDFEKASVLKMVASGKGITGEPQWLGLISCTEKISSDFEKANVLMDIAGKMPQTDNMKTAFMKAAKSISSDHEYGRVARTLK